MAYVPVDQLCTIVSTIPQSTGFISIRRSDLNINVLQTRLFYNQPVHFSVTLPINPQLPWKFWEGDTKPSWEQTVFDDSEWHSRPCDGHTSVSALTTYYRLPEPIEVPPYATAFVLSISYCGGFTAYLNGALIARFFLPAVINSTMFGEWSTNRTDRVTVPLREDTRFIMLALEVHQPNVTAGCTPTTNALFLFEPEPHIEATFTITLDEEYSNTDDVVTGAARSFRINLNVSTAVISFENRAPVMFTTMVMAPRNNMPIKVLPEQFEWSVDDLKASLDYEQGVFTSVSDMRIKLKYADNFDIFSTLYLIFNMTAIRTRSANSNICGCANQKYLTSHSNHYHTNIHHYNHTSCNSTHSSSSVSSSPQCQSLTIFQEEQVAYPWAQESGKILMNCPEGRYGMEAFNCLENGNMDVRLDHCVYYPAKDFQYNPSTYVFYVNHYGSTDQPLEEPTVSRYHLNNIIKLPEGLSLNTETGVISGTPKFPMPAKRFSIGGINEDADYYSTGEVQISVVISDCDRHDLALGDSIRLYTPLERCLWGWTEIECIDGRKTNEMVKCALPMGMCICVVCLVIIFITVIVIRHVKAKQRKLLPIRIVHDSR